MNNVILKLQEPNDARHRSTGLPTWLGKSHETHLVLVAVARNTNTVYRKDFDFVETEDGTIGRQVDMSDELRDVVSGLFELFKERHGREPEPTDRLFDGAPPLEHIEHFTVQAMKKAKVEPALIYAYEQTGLLLNHQNERLVTNADVAEWEAAIDDYEQETGNRAIRRRLNDDDFRAILGNSPD